MKLKAVFLDQDGQLVPQIPGDEKNRNIDLNETFVEGLQLLQSYGYLLVIVSGREKQADNTLNNIRGLEKSCSKLGIYLDGVYYPPTDEKVLPANTEDIAAYPLLTAAGDMDIDLKESWMVGDIVNDVAAGKRIGCNTVLVTNDDTSKTGVARYKAKNLADAARKIIKSSNRKRNTSKRKVLMA